MKLFVTGQRTFGAAALRQCIADGFEVLGASAPLGGDRPDKLRLEAELHRVPVVPSGLLRAETIPDGTDLIVAAHSHAFVGRRTRHAARVGAIGYHPSLLPRHRGRDAVRWTIHMRDAIAGGTVYWLSDNVDTGDVAANDWCFVRPDDTPSSLWARELFPMGLALIRVVLAELAGGVIRRLPQDSNAATWEPAWERAPLERPELDLIGPVPEGFRVVGEQVG